MIEFLQTAIDYVIHLDTHLAVLVASTGTWTYAILALIIFAEKAWSHPVRSASRCSLPPARRVRTR